MLKIIKEKEVFNDGLVIEEGKIKDEKNKEFTRLRIKREKASAVLIINTDSKNVILTKQFRYPIASETSHQILEIPAGKVDEGDAPLETAIREVEEETGYRVKSEQIKHLVSCFVSPGYSSERFFIYYAEVTNADKVGKGGGLESENEHIEIVEVGIEEFKNLMNEGLILDAKTLIAGLYMMHYLSK
jgi:nudix-type nucleoside diphosphatase (YffH/AdpP family)